MEIKTRIELRPSRIHKGGVGVFAVVDIKKGEKVADGLNKKDYEEIIPWSEFNNFALATRNKIMAFCVGTLDGFIPPVNLDFNRLSIEWYFNHSCEGNLGFDKNGDFVAIRKISKEEELSYDYGLVESNPKFIMKCQCGGKTCRKMITGNDWRNPIFIKKNFDHMLPQLRQQVTRFTDEGVIALSIPRKANKMR